MNPLVSVCIPTYNNPKGLYKTLECITHQTYQNLEIIIADNHSEAFHSPTVILDYLKHDTRIWAYQHPTNIGVDANYRFVRSRATGKYMMWAQDDDWWSEQFIEKLVKQLELNPQIPVAAAPARYATADGKLSELHMLKGLSPFWAVGNGDFGLICMGIWRRSEVEKYEAHLPIYVLGGDHMTIAHAMLACGAVIVVDSERYTKGYKEGRFQVCFNLDFWYSFRSWYWMVKTLVESPHIPAHRKLLLPFVALTNLFRACAITAVQVVVAMPDNPVKKIVQKRFFGAN